MEQAVRKIPVSWEVATLGDVSSKPQYGWTTKATGSGDNLKLLRTSDISSGRVNWSTVPTCVNEPEVPRKYFLNAGDIVVSRAGSVGKSFLIREDVTDAVFASYLVRFTPLISPEYVHYFMQSRLYWAQIEDQSAGIAIPNVNASKLSNLELSIAPLNEQQRIVEKIETLFARIDKGEEAVRDVQKLLTQYRQSVLKSAVTGQLTADWRAANGLPEWNGICLGDVTEFLTSGSRGWAKFYADEGDIFVRAQNIKHDRLELDDIAYVSLPAKSEGKRTRVQKDDLLITITGANVTKTAHVHEEIGTAYVSQHVALFRPTADITSEFLYWFLVAKAAGRKQLEDFAYGAGKPGLNLKNIRDVRLQLPSLKEQREISSLLADTIGKTSVLERWCETELKRSISLRQSILKDAFAGKLVPQDPADEPASDLLARIAADKPTEKKTRRKTPA